MKPKILLIDDDPLMHALYKPHLERAGFEVISLLDGVDALEVARKEQPHVIVTDMILPGQDGLATILQLKASEATKSLPIIAISTDINLESSRQHFEALGISAFLCKPFGAAKLVSEVCRAQSQLQSENPAGIAHPPRRTTWARGVSKRCQ